MSKVTIREALMMLDKLIIASIAEELLIIHHPHVVKPLLEELLRLKNENNNADN